MMQVAGAFDRVQTALSFIINQLLRRSPPTSPRSTASPPSRRRSLMRSTVRSAERNRRSASRNLAQTESLHIRGTRPCSLPNGAADREASARSISVLPRARRSSDRPFRLGQVDAVPRHCRHLALRRRQGRHPRQRRDHAAAAASLPAAGLACGPRSPTRPRKATYTAMPRSAPSMEKVKLGHLR